MNIKKLKKYDLHQAKVGDLVLCWSLNKGEVVYIDHNQGVVRWEDGLSLFDIEEEHSMYVRPLAWLGDEPVYKGDTLYSVQGGGDFTVDRLVYGMLYSNNNHYTSLEHGTHISTNLFSLTPVIKTISVNGFEVPAPMERPLEDRTWYYVPSLTVDAFYCELAWYGDGMDRLALERGLAHTTEEAAVAHAKAMLSIDPEWRRP